MTSFTVVALVIGPKWLIDLLKKIPGMLQNVKFMLCYVVCDCCPFLTINLQRHEMQTCHMCNTVIIVLQKVKHMLCYVMRDYKNVAHMAYWHPMSLEVYG